MLYIYIYVYIGSLGFLLSLKLRIIPVKKYVKVIYKPFTNLNNYCNEIRAISLKDDWLVFISSYSLY